MTKGLPLIIVCGLSGSGKTYSSTLLEKGLQNYVRIGPGLLREELNISAYSRKDTPKLLAKVIELIEENSKRGIGSIVDANLKTVDIRQFFYDTAKELGINIIVIETHCSPEVIKLRMSGRKQITAAENPKDFAVYLEQKKLWQPTDLDLELGYENLSLIRFDTEKELCQVIKVNEGVSPFIDKIFSCFTKK
ncbi:ATP-binding protein [Candidatus Woesearchaeota archaeon]|nr:ATP-binding protein [Candidatus Woesearchaeota archaeon]